MDPGHRPFAAANAAGMNHRAWAGAELQSLQFAIGPRPV